jgi:SpoVK/Ycf46/Vps4 family AAA+-type ATPase
VATRRDTLRETLAEPLPVAGWPDPARIAALDDSFPWFASITGTILRRVRLAKRLGASQLDLPPILIVGPPGIGKTRYALALAEALDRRGFLQPMAGLSSALIITGVEPSFQSAQPSLPARAALETGRADPLVILDEIEKVGTDRHHGAPLEALLPSLIGCWMPAVSFGARRQIQQPGCRRPCFRVLK